MRVGGGTLAVGTREGRRRRRGTGVGAADVEKVVGAVTNKEAAAGNVEGREHASVLHGSGVEGGGSGVHGARGVELRWCTETCLGARFLG